MLFPKQFLVIRLLLMLACSYGLVQATEAQPDIVFIVVDDLNDWVGAMGGHPQSKTPNIDALAAQGVLFTNAHCNAPQCASSRASLLKGLYPKSTGKYFNSTKRPSYFGDQPMEGITSKTPPVDPIALHQCFLESGYRVASGGKVAHSGMKRGLDAYFQRPGEKENFTNTKVNLWGEGGPQNLDDSETGDYQVAQWAIEQWNQPNEKPLLLMAGFYRPHRPLNVPIKYFEKFPLESIQLPLTPDFDDMEDLSDYAKGVAYYHAHKDPYKPRSTHEHILHLGGEQEWKYMVQSYLACINYVDTQIGLLLESLKQNPRGRETVIVLTADHGWHLGEKGNWCKAALWRNATRVPYIVVHPGVSQAGTQNNQPISLVDLYPSLCDFAGIPKPTHLEGESILPLLNDPEAKREAAFISYGPENTVAQTERYRYIRYEDGSEELYDHLNDPHEWTNLSDNPEYAGIKKMHHDRVMDFQNK